VNAGFDGRAARAVRSDNIDFAAKGTVAAAPPGEVSPFLISGM
jgi:hypothetical protein